MAANPRLEINVAKIASNAAQVVQKASAAGVKVVGVTKVCCGAPEVARAIKQGGVAMLGDSRLENIARMRDAGIPGPYMLIRIPMQSAAAETVRLADYCLLSDVTTGKVLEQKRADRVRPCAWSSWWMSATCAKVFGRMRFPGLSMNWPLSKDWKSPDWVSI